MMKQAYTLNSNLAKIIEERSRLIPDTPARFVDMDVYKIQDELDADSAKFDNGEAPPGWATRNNFSVRIVAREEAIRIAVVTSIIECLRHPMMIWSFNANAISRDSYIELSRAYPSIARARKMEICARMRDVVPEMLKLAESLRDYPAEDRDFYYALRASYSHKTWDTDRCGRCGHLRASATVALMWPCEHILCANASCAMQGTAATCAECATEERLFAISDEWCAALPPEECRMIRIDQSLRIPRAIVDRCVERL
jgi:hypothetical protein